MDLIVHGGSRIFRVRCRPTGSVLRDVTQDPAVRWVQWFSVLPGVLSLVGLLLHHTVFGSKWIVTAEPQHPTIAEPIRIKGLRKKEALRVFDDLVGAIGSNDPLSEFEKAGSGDGPSGAATASP